MFLINAPSHPPCVIHEDDHLLVVNKPPGWNTHAPAPFAGEGIYDWLRHREPRWATLAIVHRLDKETSGILVFGKTPVANRSLTEQFARRQAHKRYVCATDRPVSQDSFVVRNRLERVGDHYAAVRSGEHGDAAETRFRVVRREGSLTWLEAEPVTGRTHQIRVHAAGEGLPLLGDVLYGGTPAGRLHLHSARLQIRHPATGDEIAFEAVPDFASPASRQLREAFVDPHETTAHRVAHGASDGVPGCSIERLGDWALVLAEDPTNCSISDGLLAAMKGVYGKRWTRQVRSLAAEEASPRLLSGVEAPERFEVLENGVRFELSLKEGYSYGLFLDQRDNRRRLLRRHVAEGFSLDQAGIAPPEVLNCFAYTCAFSVCAALGGARTTSLDLSRKYLDWGRRNFSLNGIDPAAHDFIYGDVFDWLKRLAKKPRRFSVVILDPPTFSRSREHGDFRAESDYAGLVGLALPLLAPEGVLLASTNAARLRPEVFIEDVRGAVHRSGRRVLQERFQPQPPDFPMSREEPGYLKTLWMRVS